jgi:hypothetical protein
MHVSLAHQHGASRLPFPTCLFTLCLYAFTESTLRWHFSGSSWHNLAPQSSYLEYKTTTYTAFWWRIAFRFIKGVPFSIRVTKGEALFGDPLTSS